MLVTDTDNISWMMISSILIGCIFHGMVHQLSIALLAISAKSASQHSFDVIYLGQLLKKARFQLSPVFI